MSTVNDYLSPAEYAKRHKVSRTLVYKWIDLGWLPYEEFLGRLAIRRGTPRPKKNPPGRRPNPVKSV